jgi:polyhydroxyalkanoate synthesis regulator phasin
MRFIDRKAGLAIGAGIASLGLFGAVALAAFAPDTAATAGTFLPANAQQLAKDGRADKLKDLLQGLVSKGVITQAQADAILAAVKDAAGTKDRGDRAKHVLAGLFEASAKYLGMSEKDLHAKLPGHTLGEVANGTPGHDRGGLITALNIAANDAIAKALAEKKITDEQAKQLRDSLATRIPEFVDHKWPDKTTAGNGIGRGLAGFAGDLMKASRDYLGLSEKDLMTAMRSGKSLREIADTTAGKSGDGLVAAITKAANDRIDKAQAEAKLTADQAKAAKDKVAVEVKNFVDRKLPLRPAAGNPALKRPTTVTPPGAKPPTNAAPPTTEVPDKS